MTEPKGKDSVDVVAEIVHRLVSQISEADEALLAKEALHRAVPPSGDPHRAAKH